MFIALNIPLLFEANGKCYIRYPDPHTGKRKGKALDFPYTSAGIKKAANVRKRLLENADEPVAKEIGEIPTFGQLAQKRLNTARLSPETRRTQRSYLNNYWEPWFNKRVDLIHYDDIAGLANVDKAPKTIKHILAAGSQVFALAIKSRYRTDNPTTLISSDIELPTRTVDPFTRDERDAILDSLDGHQHLFYAIRFYCGLRPSECIALRWSDYRNGELFITKGRVRGNEAATTKNKVDRIVPVHPLVKSLLKETPRNIHNDHIILNQHDLPYRSSDKLANSFSRVVKRLGYRYRSPYNCRHTCATMMIEAGMKPAYCAKVLGHSLEMFFKVYAHWIDRDESDRQQKIWEGFA